MKQYPTANCIIFLDIDGVITSARTGWYDMDIFAINYLIWLCKQANAQIVISSTWRFNTSREFWLTIFPDLIHEDWKTKTFRFEGREYNRGDEIAEWLHRHDYITEYAILDDDKDMLPEQMERFIHTNSENGLMFQDMLKLKDILKIDGWWQKDFSPYISDNMFLESRQK